MVNVSNGEDFEDQKKRKRKRKRKYQKDIDSRAASKNINNKSDPLTPENTTDAEQSVKNDNRSDSMEKAILDQKKNISTEINKKKEKPAKPRTKASAKKTIEALKNDDKKLVQNDDNYKDKKMGKKGWWDR